MLQLSRKLFAIILCFIVLMFGCKEKQMEKSEKSIIRVVLEADMKEKHDMEMLLKKKREAEEKAEEERSRHERIREKERAESKILTEHVKRSFDEIKAALFEYYCLNSTNNEDVDSEKGTLDKAKYWAVIAAKRTVRRIDSDRRKRSFSIHEIEIEAQIVRPTKMSDQKFYIQTEEKFPKDRGRDIL